jgi:hypothetical protein
VAVAVTSVRGIRDAVFPDLEDAVALGTDGAVAVVVAVVAVWQWQAWQWQVWQCVAVVVK